MAIDHGRVQFIQKNQLREPENSIQQETAIDVEFARFARKNNLHHSMDLILKKTIKVLSKVNLG